MIDRIKYKEKKIYSQSGQDAFVIEFFNNKRNGVFIDIGANNGIGFSNTYYLEKELEWTGICFEPIPQSFKKLKENRSCICINAGVVDDNSLYKEFTYIENTAYMLSGITDDYHPKHIERIQNTAKKLDRKIVEIKLPCIKLDKVLEKFKLYNIDYLSIDTEGNEAKIVESIDFKKYSIKLMTIENNYNDIKQTELILSKGYKLLGKLGADEVFEKCK